MGKQFILAVTCLVSTCTLFGQRQWDRQISMKSCSISVKADLFTATTFIEMEFQNNENRETEGLFRFDLQPGQVITAFQLDLNGKFRDGSIEEKWKATNAYNTIVGKRIDPALLTMDGANHYSLRIFPFTPSGTRRVTMTIQQLMKPGQGEMNYFLPLQVENTVSHFSLDISVRNSLRPVTKKGLIENFSFSPSNPGYTLEIKTTGITLKSPLAFSIPLPRETVSCTQVAGNKNHFAVSYIPASKLEYELNPRKMVIYWDISASAKNRNLGKEISFLKQFIAYHSIEEMTIMPFNSRVMDTAHFKTGNSPGEWQNYLKNQAFSGATKLGCIDMSRQEADIYLVFSDGFNSYGRNAKTGVPRVYAVHAAPVANETILRELVGSGGGSVIDLYKLNVSDAVRAASHAQYWIIDIRSSGGRTITEQELPFPLGKINLLNGTMQSLQDTLFIYLGNNGRVSRIDPVVLNVQPCQGNALDRITMLQDFTTAINSYQWDNIIDFGLKEKVVTPNTAYIVLERVEDYIRYNISPPAELEEICNSLNYVKKDTREERKKQMERNRNTGLHHVVAVYNTRLSHWEKTEKPISMQQNILHPANQRGEGSVQTKTAGTGNSSAASINEDFTMNEVVVTSFGMSRSRKELGYSTQVIRGSELQGYYNLEQALQGKIAGVQVNSVNNFDISPQQLQNNIRIRGSASLAGNSQPVMVVDGIRVEGNINQYISVNDIDNITVLKGGSATALYGSLGANGVIVISSKKGRSSNGTFHKYRLKNREDVDYLADMKSAGIADKKNLYEILSVQHENEPGFYFDMAQHFYESGLKKEAMDILMHVVESSQGGFLVLRTAGFILENWKEYREAIAIYEWLLSQSPALTYLYRDLAWACYQDKKYQEAVDILFRGISSELTDERYIKAMMLAEMNIIIAMHRDQVDISAIPSFLIRPTPADLRIVLDCNTGYMGNISITEPGGQVCKGSQGKSKLGGVINLTSPDPYYYYHSNPAEYMLRNALPGKYRIGLNYYGGSSGPWAVPTYIRIMTFRNFGSPAQSITIENISMENQLGEIEIAEVKW